MALENYFVATGELIYYCLRNVQISVTLTQQTESQRD